MHGSKNVKRLFAVRKTMQRIDLLHLTTHRSAKELVHLRDSVQKKELFILSVCVILWHKVYLANGL